MNYNVVWKPLPGSQSLSLSCPCDEILFEVLAAPEKQRRSWLDFVVWLALATARSGEV